MVTIFSSILGGCISGAVGFAAAYCMSVINARRVAADRLRAAFAPELAFMRRAHADTSVNRNQLLKDAFPRHGIAVEEYRPFPRRSRDAYQKAWQEYYEVGGSVRFYDYYMQDLDGGKEDGPEIFIRRVENILIFAAPPRFARCDFS
jgi:hypothetical protein